MLFVEYFGRPAFSRALLIATEISSVPYCRAGFGVGVGVSVGAVVGIGVGEGVFVTGGVVGTGDGVFVGRGVFVGVGAFVGALVGAFVGSLLIAGVGVFSPTEPDGAGVFGTSVGDCVIVGAAGSVGDGGTCVIEGMSVTPRVGVCVAAGVPVFMTTCVGAGDVN